MYEEGHLCCYLEIVRISCLFSLCSFRRVQYPLYFICRIFDNSYGAPLGQRASYLALHSSLFGPDGAANYDYIVTNSIDCLSETLPLVINEATKKHPNIMFQKH